MKLRSAVLILFATAATVRTASAEPGGVCAPFGRFAKLLPGMTPTAFAAAAPKFKDHKTFFDLVDGDTQYRAFVSNGHVDRLEIRGKAAPAAVTKAWGTADPLRSGVLYLNPTAHLRCTLDDKTLTFERYRPLAESFTGTDPFAYLGVAVLGRPVDEAVKDLATGGVDFGTAKADSSRTGEGPANEYAQSASFGLRAGADGRVASYNVLPLGFKPSAERLQALRDVLVKRFGAEKVDGKNFSYGRDGRVKLDSFGNVEISTR
jgi:hypothetical protein